jgi:hypothetical protein
MREFQVTGYKFQVSGINNQDTGLRLAGCIRTPVRCNLELSTYFVFSIEHRPPACNDPSNF